MTAKPIVSVVMAVRNGGHALAETIHSVMAQQGVAFELLVVDDGSDDGTGDLLSELARRDDRIRVLRQDNTGLTVALARACEQVQAPFIARQDAGDRSLPGRLAAQLRTLEESPRAVLCSTHVEFRAPLGEWLFVATPDATEIESGRIGPAHHGSVMMRTADYRAVGGYRPAFYFAQDLDLWSRLHERGRHAVVPHLLYEATVSVASISGSHAAEQRALSGLIRAAADARRRGFPEAEILSQAAKIRPIPGTKRTRSQRAAGAYFIGACLRQRDPVASRRYFREALAAAPWHVPAWFRWLQTCMP